MAPTKKKISSSTPVPLIIPKARFQRLVCEVIQNSNLGVQIQPKAVVLLQEAAEAYLVSLFKDTNLCALRSSRATIVLEDMKQALYTHGERDLCVREPPHNAHSARRSI